ncbi:hypothetical protein HYALB_00012629 [Hymenoscyphus albidus]|uniref:Uncharacterized protein n=1 Tax=Hymenoscyphus albidus TaxID=595503 RepID=A0A9N9LWF1_9HELO|nr:hypothetical protein HYALB_00012629 [Hymenoscyphus albidus]
MPAIRVRFVQSRENEMSTTLIIVAVVTTIFFLWKFLAPQPKLKIPHVQFRSDNSMARYRAETKTLMGEGYEKYTRNGQAFSIRNAYNPKRPIAILPMKYLEEVKNAPQTGLSYPLVSERVFTNLGDQCFNKI